MGGNQAIGITKKGLVPLLWQIYIDETIIPMKPGVACMGILCFINLKLYGSKMEEKKSKKKKNTKIKWLSIIWVYFIT